MDVGKNVIARHWRARQIGFKKAQKMPSQQFKDRLPQSVTFTAAPPAPTALFASSPPTPQPQKGETKEKIPKKKNIFHDKVADKQKSQKLLLCVFHSNFIFFHFYFNWVMWKGGSDAAWGWRMRPERAKKRKLIEFRKNNTPREKGKHTKLRTPPVPHSVIYQHARNCRKKNFRRFFFFARPGCIVKYALLHYRKVFGAFLGKF